MTPTQYLLLILAGGTGTPLLVFAIARHLVERHADEYADAARRQRREAAARDAARHNRRKELTR